MELKDKSTAASDDEDDLEKLRLAALQSLKRTTLDESKSIHKNSNKPSQTQHKRRNFQGRISRNGQFYNRQKNTNLISIPTVGNESIGSNLKNDSNTKYSDNHIHKLVLPQDRYCNTKSVESKPTEPCSKFDRYDNSDKSESESEYDDNIDSESELPGKLEKTNSLEALMQELENEIQGDSKLKEEKEKLVKPNKIRKRKMKTSMSEISKENESKKVVITENLKENVEIKKLDKDLFIDVKEEGKESKTEAKKNFSKSNSNSNSNIDHQKSPLNKRFYKKYLERNVNNTSAFLPHQPYVPPIIYPENVHFNHTLPFNQVVPYNNNLILNQPLLPLNIPQNYVHPTTYERPPSPLSLNTDDVLTITRAPLSPRSAAFVLQNREIIERRKKSPRRSYSRSPSPRYRRSTSPGSYGRINRTPSPRKFTKSKSRSPHPTSEILRKLSPTKDKPDLMRDRRTPPIQDKRSSPRTSPVRDRRSPLRLKLSPHRQKHSDKRSPNSRRTTPIDKSPKTNYRNSPKGSVRERLGNKTSRSNANVDINQEKTKKRSRSLSLSPEPQEVKEKNQNNDKEVLDPILEARRKKFETNEIKNTEGIIRLKPKIEKTTDNEDTKETLPNIVNNNEENTHEDELLDLLNTKVDDIFSDEETDEENEGRFKSSLNNPQRNVSVLPFTQLMEDPTRSVKTEVLKSTTQSTRVNERDRTTDRNRKRQRSRSPLRSKDTRNHKEKSKASDESKVDRGVRKQSTKEKLYARNRILFRNGSSSRREKVPVTAPIENKKIEIKIRNPSKYETTTKYDVANEHETLERIEKSVRKVEVSDTKKESDIENSDTEIINYNEEELDNMEINLSQKCEAGDLRAQLSRKRAERQNKLPVPEDVQSRLLQNALQGAVFKKPKKSRKEKDSAPKEFAAVKRTATTVTNLGYGIMKIKNNKFLSGERKVRFLYTDSKPVGDCPDGKLPIHLRLGFANSMDIFQEPNIKRKRSKSKGRIEQV